MAEFAGVAASTLRAYLSRGEGDTPAPQAVVGGRSLWARPVAEEWAERRRRSWGGIVEAMSVDRRGSSLPVGVADLWRWFTRVFVMDLWEHPARRKRWALRWRSAGAVRDVAEELGWSVAASIDRIFPTDDLAVTVRYAVLAVMADQQRPIGDSGEQPEGMIFYGIVRPVAKTLDWLIRHKPGHAAAAIGEIVGDAERDLNVPRDVTVNSLRTAMALDGKLDANAYNEFFDGILPETNT
jgi:hypothetical protein